LIIQSLISRSANLDQKEKNPNLVEFIRINQDDNLQERTRQIPEKPPQPKRPPQPEIELDDKTPPPVQQFDLDLPDFNLPTDFSGAFLGNINDMGRGTSQLIPLVKIAPRCPSEAAMGGINGSVVLELLVNESGRVDTIKIKQARPSRIFNKEALKAVRRWQFKPKSVDGVTVPQLGLLTVEFVCDV
jgi:protein TonB